MASDRTVEDVLREMDEVSREEHLDAYTGGMVLDWLAVLRPALAQAPGPAAQETTWRLEAERLREVVRNLEARARDQSQAPSLTTWWTGGHPTADPHVEVFPIKSGLPQRLLRDLGITIELRADHEGTGEIRMDYTAAPAEHRLQALLSIMGAVGDRIAYAIGNEAYVNLLRGIVARREREL